MPRKLSLFLLVVVLAFSIVSCTQPTATPPASEKPAEPSSPTEAPTAPTDVGIRNLSIGGAGTSGTFYIMAAAYADLITKNNGINSVAEVTAGSVENVKLLEDGKIELGVVQLDVAMNATQGKGQFDTPVPLKVIAPMYPNVIQIVTLKDSPINSFADLKGKRVSVGSPGSGILATNEVILETLGLSLDDINPQYLSFAESTDAFRNNAIDAVIVNTAAPAPFLTDLETTNELKFVPLSEEEIAKFTQGFDFYVESTIEGGTYGSIPEDTKTFAVWIALMAREDFPEEAAYQITKTLLENEEHLKDVHVVAKHMTLDNVKNLKGVEYHPGSLRYLEEQGAKFE